jgi:hypothetical protein
MLGPRSYFEIVAAFAHRNTAHDKDLSAQCRLPETKGGSFASAPSASSARRRLFSNSGKDGLIAPRPMTAGGTDDADGANGVFGARAHPYHSRPGAAFTGCQSRRDTRRHTYRFFPVALAVLPRTTSPQPSALTRWQA